MFPEFEYEYVTYEELYKAYSDCRRHKWKTSNAAHFQVDLAKNLYQLWIDLNKGRYKIGRSIAFIVDKPVYREVFAADFRDRIVHHLLINRIIFAFEEEMIDNSFSCRKGKGTLYGIKTLEKEVNLITNGYKEKAYVLKCDLKSFFMTIGKDMLYHKIDNLIRNKVYNNDTKQYEFTTGLAKLIIHNCPQYDCIRKHEVKKWSLLPREKSLFNIPVTHGIPIGNLTSQIFANYLLNDFDKFIYEELGFRYYGRYVDDFYILSNNKDSLIKVIPRLKAKLSEIGAHLHPNKIYIQDINKGVQFIGGIIKPNRTYITNRTIGNLKRFLVKKEIEFENKIITANDIEKLVNGFNSYMGFLKHHATYNIRKKIVLGHLMKPFLMLCYFDKKYLIMRPFKEYSAFDKGLSITDAIQIPLII